MARKENIYCTLDTETWGGASRPKGVYNCAGQIHNRKGDVIACFNYLIAEYFDVIQKDDYAKKNFHKYRQMIDEGSITLVASEDEMIQAVENVLSFYGVDYVMAYNSAFDFGKTKCRELLNGREFIDIYLMAVQTLAQYKKYSNFCIENNLKSKSSKRKSVSTTAETMYAYITNNPTYQEEHTAMEDSKIEKEIFLACLATHKKYTKNCHWYDYKGTDKCVPQW